MGLLRKLKKLAKPLLSAAIKTAPMWSSFIPGGSIVGQAIAKSQSFRGAVRGFVPNGPQALATLKGFRKPRTSLQFNRRGTLNRSRVVRFRRRAAGPLRLRYLRSRIRMGAGRGLMPRAS